MNGPAVRRAAGFALGMALAVSSLAHIGYGAFGMACGASSELLGNSLSERSDDGSMTGEVGDVLSETGRSVQVVGFVMVFLGFAQILGIWAVARAAWQVLLVVGALSLAVHVAGLWSDPSEPVLAAGAVSLWTFGHAVWVWRAGPQPDASEPPTR